MTIGACFFFPASWLGTIFGMNIQVPFDVGDTVNLWSDPMWFWLEIILIFVVTVIIALYGWRVGWYRQ